MNWHSFFGAIILMLGVVNLIIGVIHVDSWYPLKTVGFFITSAILIALSVGILNAK